MTARNDPAAYEMVGRIWIFLGAIFLIFVTAATIAVYGFGAKVTRHAGAIAVPIPFWAWLILFGLAGAGLIVVGSKLLRRAARMYGEE